MEIVTTYREIHDKGAWEQFCEDTGLCVWCMNEGADPDTKVTLTIKQALKYRLLEDV